MPIFLHPVGLSLPSLEILFALVAIGVGAVFPVTTVSVQNAVAVHQLGTATALITFMRNLGAAGGVAIFGTIVLGGGGPVPGLAGHNGQAVAIGGADYVDHFRFIFLAGAIGFLLAFAILSQMEERPLGTRSGQLRGRN